MNSSENLRTHENDRRFVETRRTHPRYWKTAAKLAAAVIELAAENPSAQLTVGEIVQRASMNRSTFYTHGRNATDLLNKAMRMALEGAEAPGPMIMTSADDRRAALLLAVGTVADHIRQYRTVYETALTDDASADALFRNLTDYIARRLRLEGASLATVRGRAIAAATSEIIRERISAFELFNANDIVETLDTILISEFPGVKR